jgi:hypothetical protein
VSIEHAVDESTTIDVPSLVEPTAFDEDMIEHMMDFSQVT